MAARLPYVEREEAAPAANVTHRVREGLGVELERS